MKFGAVLLLIAAVLLFGCDGRGNGAATPTPIATSSGTPTQFPTTPAPTATPAPSGTPGPECASDADCVPAQCCHPTTCAPVGRAPDCAGIACTMVCMPSTMDCGAGSCACIGGICGVSWVRETPTPAERPTPEPTPFRLCRSTTRAGEWAKRGVSLGEYNGRIGLYDDTCMWNGNETVLVKYSCNLLNGSNEVVREFHSCTTRCISGECDDCECGSEERVVCGADNRTYENECMANCHGANMTRYGPCDPNCFALNQTCRASADCCSMKCDPWSRTCVDCVLDSDCAQGKACIGGMCAAECVEDYDCPAGEFCYGGRCG